MSIKIVEGSKVNIPPLPRTTRGFGIHIDGTLQREKRLLYCNKRFVVVRSLENQFDGKIFTGHTCNVNVAKFSPNGIWVASGDSEGKVFIWEADSFKIKNELKINNGILDISWGDDNSQIIASGEGTAETFAKVFRIDSSNSIGNIQYHSKKINSCAIKPTKPSFIVTASEDYGVNVYQGIPYKYVKNHKNHSNYVNCVRYNSSGEKFASVGSDKLICIYSGEGEFLKKIDSKSKDAHKGSIYSCSFNPEGTQLLTASGDKTAKIWDCESGECLKTFELGKEVNDMQVSCLWLEGYLISVSLSGNINFLDERGEKNLREIWTGHQTQVMDIAVSPEQKKVFSSDMSGDIVGWDLNDNTSFKFKTTKENEKGLVNTVALSADKTKLYSTSFQDHIFVSDIENRMTENLFPLEGQPSCLALGNKNSNLIVVGTVSSALYLSSDSGSNFKKVGLKYVPTAASFSPNDSLLVVGGKNHIVYVYELNGADLDLKKELKNHLKEVSFVGFSSEGNYLLTSCKLTYAWKADEGFEKPLNSNGWPYHGMNVTGAIMIESLERVVTGAMDEKLTIISNFKKGNRARRNQILGHVSGVSSVKEFEEKTFITMGVDGFIRVWGHEQT